MSKYRLKNNPYGYPTDEAINLVSEIKWESDDKDNMVFKTRITCYQKEALEAFISCILESY